MSQLLKSSNNSKSITLVGLVLNLLCLSIPPSDLLISQPGNASSLTTSYLAIRLPPFVPRFRYVEGANSKVQTEPNSQSSLIFMGETPTGGHILVKNLNFSPVL